VQKRPCTRNIAVVKKGRKKDPKKKLVRPIMGPERRENVQSEKKKLKNLQKKRKKNLLQGTGERQGKQQRSHHWVHAKGSQGFWNLKKQG